MSNRERRLWTLSLIMALACEGFCPPKDMYDFLSSWAKCLQR